MGSITVTFLTWITSKGQFMSWSLGVWRLRFVSCKGDSLDSTLVNTRDSYTCIGVQLCRYILPYVNLKGKVKGYFISHPHILERSSIRARYYWSRIWSQIRGVTIRFDLEWLTLKTQDHCHQAQIKLGEQYKSATLRVNRLGTSMGKSGSTIRFHLQRPWKGEIRRLANNIARTFLFRYYEKV